MKHVLRVPDLDLPNTLLQKVLDELDTGRAVMGNHNYKSTNDCITEKILRLVSLGRGGGRVYRLTDQLESEISHHYQYLIDHFSIPCKIRIKSFQNVNWVPIHADRSPTSPQGDTTTLTIGIRTNGEITNFYDWKGGDIYQSSLRNLLSCRRVDSIRIDPGQAYFFNNAQPHSVTGFTGAPRFVLCLGWPGLDYNEIKHMYPELCHA